MRGEPTERLPLMNSNTKLLRSEMIVDEDKKVKPA
jgi:hypothetical protein